MIPVLLSVIAIVSYLLGNLNAVSIVSRLVFQRSLPPESGDEAMVAMNRMFDVPGIAAVAVLDAAKAMVAVLLGGLLLGVAGGEPADSTISYAVVGRLFAAFCLLLGHAWPVLNDFRGGKGGVCALAAMLCVNFPLGVLSALVFVGVTAASRYLSLGTLVAAIIAPFGIWVEYGGLCALLSLFCVLVIVVRHWRNLRRLLRRREPKLDFKKDLSMKFEEEDF